MGARLRQAAPMIVYAAGLAMFAAGVAMVYVPAGIIVAGASAAASAVLYVRGSATATIRGARGGRR